MTGNKNTILAIVLSAIVLIGWQYFVGMPHLERQKQEALLREQQQQQSQAAPGTPAPGQTPGAQAPNQAPSQAPGAAVQAPAAATPVAPAARESVIAASPRVRIETPLLNGSIALKGGRIDDLSLTRFRETVDPTSPAIVLLAPSGTEHPFYAEFGWVAASGATAKLPDADTVWTQQGSGPLTAARPVTLTYDNGEGLEFRRIISVDDKYMFTIEQQVINKGTSPVSLFPFSLISRHGLPHMAGYTVLHEGPIGVMGDKCLRQSFGILTECQEESYHTLEEKKTIQLNVSNAWFGFTDKYWATTLIPNQKAEVQARFSANTIGNVKTYQADYLGQQQTVAPGATASTTGRVFAGPKEVALVNDYEQDLGINRFELLIDWGHFYFITKPLFKLIDYIYHLVGNFGIAILIVTVLVKTAFFPLANKSYASMAKMKAVQPQMQMIRERYGDDKIKQQQALMELYKKEKINPLAGCLPILIQIPVFFALYKVLFVTIEMRHAPFFGWIRDLASPDPTNLFTLFGLIPWDPTQLPVVGHFLVLGIWPIIMGITMWAQMKLNPSPPDPTQKMIFDWMPLVFTFMLASFPAGLVIYWAWNNSLSVLQQSVIMRKHGAKVELWDNIKGLFQKKATSSSNKK